MAVVTPPKNLVEAVRALEGRSVEEGLRSMILNRVMLRLDENQSKSKTFARKYRSILRSRKKILRKPHAWQEESALFEWDSIRTENRRLRRILSESGA